MEVPTVFLFYETLSLTQSETFFNFQTEISVIFVLDF